MVNLLFFLILSGGAALALTIAYTLFEIFLFLLYKHDGGQLDLISYIKKL